MKIVLFEEIEKKKRSQKNYLRTRACEEDKVIDDDNSARNLLENNQLYPDRDSDKDSILSK